MVHWKLTPERYFPGFYFALFYLNLSAETMMDEISMKIAFFKTNRPHDAAEKGEKER